MGGVLIIVFLLCILFYSYNRQFYESFASEYPCRVVLSDVDFLKHMIPHHQMAIDISIAHIKKTKSDTIMKVLRELIWTQEYEVTMMREELEHKTENITDLRSNLPFVPTTLSYTSPNIIGLTDVYCDPAFFVSHGHKHEHKILTDRDYIQHMIPHHQVAVDMCKILLKHTRSDFLISLAYRMITAQEAEILLLNDLLKSHLQI